jgi:hypothetical protein
MLKCVVNPPHASLQVISYRLVFAEGLSSYGAQEMDYAYSNSVFGIFNILLGCMLFKSAQVNSPPVVHQIGNLKKFYAVPSLGCLITPVGKRSAANTSIKASQRKYIIKE